MPEARHLQNAPIREAIIDLRVKARGDLQATELSGARDQMREKYPTVEEQRGFGAEIQVGPELRQATTRDFGLQGYLFKSSDGRSIAQFRTDGFTFNRLRPYTRWEILFPEALQAWELYRRVARPEVVTRLAVRYINHIPIPPNLDLDEYLTTVRGSRRRYRSF